MAETKTAGAKSVGGTKSVGGAKSASGRGDAGAAPVAKAAAKKKGTSNPFTFLQQVRSETAKVTWPTRRETMVSTIMVFIMVAFAAAFFFLADQLLGYLVGLIMNFRG